MKLKNPYDSIIISPIKQIVCYLLHKTLLYGKEQQLRQCSKDSQCNEYKASTEQGGNEIIVTLQHPK